MNAMPPTPVTLTDDLVTIARADWDAYLNEIQDAADRATVAASLANPETDALRRGFTDAEVGRILDGETRLCVLRDRTGMNTRQMAIKADANYNYVREIEAGKKPGSAAVLGRLAAVIGVPLEMFLA